MALNSLGLGFLFTAKDLASGKISQLARTFGKMDRAALSANESYQRNFAAMGMGLGIMAAGALTLAGAFALANEAGAFEKQIAKVGAISKATAEELQLLRNAAIKAGIETQFSPTESAEGLENLASQGFNARESIELLVPALDLAAGGQISVSSATAAVSSAVRVFSLDMEEAKTSADKLLAVSNQTALAAGDLELALGTVGRGASLTGQKLDEMLISMGLVKNTGVDASVAAQSVSSALVFMAGRADKFKALGVSITDAQGKFRPFLDVVTDTSKVLGEKYTDEAERAAMATDLFSRFGLQAYSAIVTQLGKGIRNETTGDLLTGADAMEYLRQRMAASAGTAEKFKQQMLDTFEGQKTLLVGAVQTLGVVLGEPFAAAFKPMVSLVLAAVTSMVEFIESIPPEVKGPLFKTIVVVAGLATAFGAVVTAVAGFLILKPFLLTMALAMGGIASAMVPVLVVIGAVALAVTAFRQVVQKNLGGIGDGFHRFTEGASMAVRGLIQLFTQGGFSGAVLDFFAEAENEGLRSFVISLFQVGFRVVQFFRGLREGFSAGMDAAAPAFERLGAALTRLGEALGFVGAAGPKALAGVPSEAFGQRGAKIGLVLAKVVEWVVDVGTAVARFVSGFIEGFSAAVAFFAPVFETLGPMLEWLGSEFWNLLSVLGIATGAAGKGASGWQMFGQVVGGVVGGGLSLLVGVLEVVMLALGGVMKVLGFVGGAFRSLVSVVIWAGTIIWNILGAVKAGFMNLLDSIVVGLGALASKVPVGMRPEWAASLSTAGDEAEARISKRTGAVDKLEASWAFKDSVGLAEAEGNAQDSRAQQDAMYRVAKMVQDQKEQRNQEAARSIQLNLDGEKVGELLEATGRKRAARAFQPVGSLT